MILWFFVPGRAHSVARQDRFGVCAFDRSRARSTTTDEADADDTTADPEAPETEDLPREVAPHGGVPAEARRLHPRLHDDAEEAELGAS